MSPDDARTDESDDDYAVQNAPSSMAPSTATRRLTEMLVDLEDSSESLHRAVAAQPSYSALQGIDDGSPSKTGKPGRPPSDGPPSASLPPQEDAPGAAHRVFSCSHTSEPPSGLGPSQSVGRNGTFLTDASFGVAHDKLVQIITDVQPFEPYWENLTDIDLSGKNIESVARLKELLPRLDSLTM